LLEFAQLRLAFSVPSADIGGKQISVIAAECSDLVKHLAARGAPNEKTHDASAGDSLDFISRILSRHRSWRE